MFRDGLLGDLRCGDWAAARPKLLRRLAATVRLRNFPAPSGGDTWSADELDDMVQDFLADKTGPARLVQLAINATDETHCHRLVDKTIKNFLADRAREDPRPKFRRTLREACTSDPTLDFDHDCIRRAGTPAEAAFAGNQDDLPRAAQRVEVAPPPWGEDAEREGPPTDRASLVALCHAVLDAAGAPVELRVMTSVLAERLEIRRAWDDRFDSSLDEPTQSVTDRSGAVSAGAYLLGVEIWEELDDRERELITFVGTGGRTGTEESDIDLGRSAVQDRLTALQRKLSEALDGIADAEGVVRALFLLHADWKVSGGRAPEVVRRSPMRGENTAHRPTQKPGTP